MKPAAAIFDLDGTLIDSIRDIGESMNRALSGMRFPTHPIQDYQHFIGDGVKMLIRRVVPDDAPEEIQAKILERYRLDYQSSWNVHTRPYPGIPEMLDLFSSAGIPMGVLSNKPDDVTKLCVSHFFPGITFHAVAGQKDGVPRKPDPAAALTMARTLLVEPEACALIGDTSTDMQTALAATMFPAGVLWGFRGEKELRDNGARLLAITPEALLGLFQIPTRPNDRT